MKIRRVPIKRIECIQCGRRYFHAVADERRELTSSCDTCGGWSRFKVISPIDLFIEEAKDE